MTILDVHLSGIDSAGGPVSEVTAFWWDAYQLKKLLGDRLQPCEPSPAWEGRVPAAELRSFAQAHRNVWQAKREAFNDAVDDLLARSEWVHIRIEES